MTLQMVYHNTGITLDDVNDAIMQGKLDMAFDVEPRSDDLVHVMLYPYQYPKTIVQLINNAANIWTQNFDESHRIETLLNKIFGKKSNPRPFKEPNIVRGPGELRKILDTPLGIITTFVYYFPDVIAEAVSQYMDLSYNW